MPPAKRGVRVHYEVLNMLTFRDDIFENAPPKLVKPLKGYIQNLTPGNVRRFSVHHIPDVAEHGLFASLGGQSASPFEVALLVDPHHPCHGYNHCRSYFLRLKTLQSLLPVVIL